MKGIEIGIRITAQDAKKLKEIAEARGESVSAFVRRSIFKEFALLGFLDENQKKSLGL